MEQIIQVSEETLVADIERRLVDEFPYVSAMVVDTLIRKEHARFEASRIRDFVPFLWRYAPPANSKHRSNWRQHRAARQAGHLSRRLVVHPPNSHPDQPPWSN